MQEAILIKVEAKDELNHKRRIDELMSKFTLSNSYFSLFVSEFSSKISKF